MTSFTLMLATGVVGLKVGGQLTDNRIEMGGETMRGREEADRRLRWDAADR